MYVSDGLSDLNDMIFIEIHNIHEMKLSITLKLHYFEIVTFEILDLEVHWYEKVDYLCYW